MHPLAVLHAALYPESHLLVGFEDDADGSLRVYLDHRSTGIHTHVIGEAAKDEVRTAYMPATTVSVPASALCDCPPPTPKEA